MTREAAEQLLFPAVERVIAAERKLANARAEYEKVYTEIFGERDTPHCGGTPSGSEGEVPRVVSNTGDVAAGASSVLTALDHDGRRYTIRARVEQYCRENRDRILTAETIANALGTKLTTTRFELYQLRERKIVVKLGIDQWKYANPPADG
jgi:hypothetical protein